MGGIASAIRDLSEAEHQRRSELINSMGQDRERVFPTLYQTTAHHIAALARIDCEVQEVVDDVLLHVCLHSAHYDPNRGAAGAWLTALTRNTAINCYRRRRVHLSRENEAMRRALKRIPWT